MNFRRNLVPIITLATAASLSLGGCHRDPNVRKHKYLESGLRYEKNGKQREALIQFANAIKIDKNFAEAHYELGKLYLAMGSPQSAYPEMLAAVESKPSDIKVRLALADVELNGGLVNEAKEQGTAVLALQPNNADAHALLAQIAIRQNDMKVARDQIQQALAIEPNRSQFHVTLAAIEAASSASLSAAQTELQRAISLDSKNGQAHVMMAEILEKNGKPQDAIEQIHAAVTAQPSSLTIRRNLVDAYLRMGSKQSAELELRGIANDFADDRTGASLLSDYYLQTGQIGLADSSYESLVKAHPKSIEIRSAYARILLIEGKKDKASGIVADLVKEQPENPEVVVLNATLLSLNGKADQALGTIQRAVKESPDNAELQMALGKISLRQGDLNTAQTAYQDALRLAPHNLEVLSGAAAVADQKHDYSSLMQIAGKTIAFAGDFAPAYVWRATAEANQNEIPKAEEDFQIALQKDPHNEAALTELGQIWVRQKRTKEAAELFAKILQVDPNSAQALHALVEIDLNANQPSQAVDHINQQIARSAANPDLYKMLASLKLTLKDYPGAREAATKALQMNPGDETAVRLAAQGAAGAGDPGAAVNLIQNWISGHPSDAGAFTTLGMMQEAKGDQAGAMNSYKKALQLKPEDPIANNNLAFLMVESGQSADDALTFAQDARRALPQSPQTEDTLAWVYYHLGRYSSARDLLEDAVKVNPNSASAQYHLGLVYSQLGDKSNATTHLKKAVAVANGSPTAAKANEALSKL